MRTNQKVFLAATALAVALMSGGPALAECVGNPGTISTLSSAANTSQQSQVFTEAWLAGGAYYDSAGSIGGGATQYCYTALASCPPPVTNPSGHFWVQGEGFPGGSAPDTGGPGGPYDEDHGDLNVGNGLSFAATDYPAFGSSRTHGAQFDSNFAPGSGTHGCPDSGDCLCLLLTDHDGSSNSYFALVSDSVAATRTTLLTQPGTDGSGLYAGAIVLRAIPQPTIVSVVRDPDGVGAGNPAVDETVVDFTVVVSIPDNPSGGIYEGCDCGPIGYKILEQIITGAGARLPANAPSDRASGWTPSVLSNGNPQSVTSLGTPTTVRTDYGNAEEAVYLTVELFFEPDIFGNEGYATSVVSANSVQVNCGVNLAHPDDKPVDLRRTIERKRRDLPRRR